MGRAASALFVREGARVVLVDISAEGAERAAKEIDPQGGKTLAFAADVADSARMHAAVERSIEHFGAVDILFNNAGYPMEFTAIEDVDERLYQRVMDVNVKGVFVGSQAVVRHMKERRAGCIINTSSVAALRPRPGLTAYCAAKSAVITMTKALALELAPHQVRVNCIAPGATDTPMLPGFIGLKNDFEKGRAMYIGSIPLGRLATPQDIAAGALYLASDDAAFVTGEVLTIDGGRGV
ncbi:MAG: SDR family oxidoreductase [bacterium]|nr:SDR family oxidoreductase [bacterium]